MDGASKKKTDKSKVEKVTKNETKTWVANGC